MTVKNGNTKKSGSQKQKHDEGYKDVLSDSATFRNPRVFGRPGRSPLRDGVDFDFNILTAFIRLGRAGPVGAGCPPYS